MEKTIQKRLHTILYQSASIGITVIGAVLLPQLFHALGGIMETGGQLGQMFLPMYLPVLMFAFQTNAVAGMLAGLLSPLISYAISGMPTPSLLPFMMVELACFGLFAGWLSSTKLNPFAKVFIVQLASRLVRVGVTVLFGYLVSNDTIAASAVLGTVIVALPGYLLQLLIVPYWLNKGVLKNE